MWGEPVELSVTFIDTADAYGPFLSERSIRTVLHPYPGDLVIATKAGQARPAPGKWVALGPEYLRQQAELSLRHLGVETIVLVQLHRIDPAVPLADQVGELTKLPDEGKIRYIGLSEVGVAELCAARQIAEIVSVQYCCNVAERNAEPVLEYAQAPGRHRRTSAARRRSLSAVRFAATNSRRRSGCPPAADGMACPRDCETRAEIQ